MADAGPYDVIVVGAGNAALCAALSAQEQGAKVLVLEKASEEERGGNSTFTAGGFRFVHNGVDDLRRDVLVDLSEAEAKQMYIPPFTAEIYMDDLMRVTENLSEPDLADLLVSRSRETVVWMREKGVRWIPMFKRQSYHGERHPALLRRHGGRGGRRRLGPGRFPVHARPSATASRCATTPACAS